MKNLKKIVWLVLLALLLAGNLMSVPGPAAGSDPIESLFVLGKNAVHDKQWQDAVTHWGKFVSQHARDPRGAEAYYWLAYSLNQAAGEATNPEKQSTLREQAMENVGRLLERHAKSSWATDARMLRIELAESLVKAGKVQYKKYITRGAEAGNGSDINVKLVALDALLQMDEEKALPILKKIIRESKDKNIRAKAVFVLSQHDDPSVAPLLNEVARKDEDPYVREQAVFWLGQQEGDVGLRNLIALYAEGKDKKLKEKILFAISQSQSEASFAKLLDIAKTDPDLELRAKALFWIGQSDDEKAPAALMEMYRANSDNDLKKKIVFSLGQLPDDRGTAFLKEIATGNSPENLHT
jgi:HEAT repeat protein